MDWARGVIQGLARRNKHRLPIITSSIVAKVSSLYKKSDVNVDVVLSSFTMEDMKQGIVRDKSGHEAIFQGETGRLLLNANIISIEDEMMMLSST